ncbi:hypothetical protein Hanom_Chr08g00756851 [Helianthus anomalus]
MLNLSFSYFVITSVVNRRALRDSQYVFFLVFRIRCIRFSSMCELDFILCTYTICIELDGITFRTK